MLTHKSLRLLATFSRRELQNLKDFLASPYFNKSAKVQELYAILYPHFPVRENEKEEIRQARAIALESVNLFSILFPEKEKESTHLAVLLNSFQKLLERFLLEEKFQAHPFRSQEFLLESLAYREGQEELFQKNWEIGQALYTSALDSTEKLGHKFKLENMLMSHILHSQDRSKDSNVAPTLQALEIYMLAEYLRYSLGAVNIGMIMNQSYAPQFLELLLTYLEKQTIEHYPALVQLYFHATRCFLEAENIALYEKLKIELQKHSLQVNPEDAFELYQLTINYLIRRNRKEGNLLPEIFSYYQDAEQKKLFYQSDGKLHPAVFTSIVTAGISLSRLSSDTEKQIRYKQWVENFIERNQHFLPQYQQEYAVKYARAFIFFSEKNFSAALKILPDNSKDVISEFTRRRLLLRIYYELGEYESLFALGESTSKYIRRALHVSSTKAESSLNFIRYLEKICKLKSASARTRIQKLQVNITQEPLLEHRDWLLAKVKKILS